MRWTLWSTVVFLMATFSSQAFVVKTISGTIGGVIRWNLVSLPGAVHTNVVNPATRAVRYFLASDAWSSTNTAAELNAVRASFDQWQSISGTILKFEDAGLVAPGVDVNTSDHKNVVFWAKGSTMVNGGQDDISGFLGVTYLSNHAEDGSLREADIVLNGVDYGWDTDFNRASTSQFVEGTALHEIGHFIGLSHSPLGGATMLSSGSFGIDAQVGLSLDEVWAARFLYAATNQPGLRGTLQGQVTRNGAGVFGAIVVAEDNTGRTVAGTVARSNGFYELSALPPGQYQIRVTPLDSASAQDYLLQGQDISPEYDSAETRFLPTTNATVTLAAGVTNTLNFAVVNAEPPFRIAFIRGATGNQNSFSWGPFPTLLRTGQSNLTVGVVSPSLPTNGATLTISGDGLTLGAVSFRTNGFGTGLNFISVRISVASNATPGLRSFMVQHGTNLAYANGFLEILSLRPDYNFDGLDDYFQRQYFPLFTSTNAAPSADPDGDGFINSAEYTAGTAPTNASSLLKIDQVKHTTTGTTVLWRSVAGKRYQVYSRPTFVGSMWQAVGAPATGNGPTTQFLDEGATSGNRFYRVEVLP